LSKAHQCLSKAHQSLSKAHQSSPIQSFGELWIGLARFGLDWRIGMVHWKKGKKREKWWDCIKERRD